jgi:hypothetical protein
MCVLESYYAADEYYEIIVSNMSLWTYLSISFTFVFGTETNKWKSTFSKKKIKAFYTAFC